LKTKFDDSPIRLGLLGHFVVALPLLAMSSDSPAIGTTAAPAEAPADAAAPPGSKATFSGRRTGRPKVSEGLARAGEGAALPQKKFFRSRAHINPLNKTPAEGCELCVRAQFAGGYPDSTLPPMLLAARLVPTRTTGRSTSRRSLTPLTLSIAACSRAWAL